jgi:Peptidase family S41
MAVFVPSFRVLDADAPRPVPLVAGTVVSLLALSLLLALPNRSGIDRSSKAAIGRSERPPFQSRRSPSRDAAPQNASRRTSTEAAGRAAAGEPVSSVARADVRERSNTARQSGSQDAAGAVVQGASQRPRAGPQVDAAERRRVIDGAIAELMEYYIYPDVGQKMADALLAHEKRGDDDAETDGQGFANLLTMQMREVSHDRHLGMDYRPEENSGSLTGPTAEELARYRSDMRRENCTFEKVAILAHNIGYVKFDGFPGLSICRSTVARVMASLNHADALIFDVRDNHGGDPHMVALIASYLFDRRTHLNDIYTRTEGTPTEGTTEQFWTQSPIGGNRLADKPVYVLTSAATFSGAEEFCYDLKNLKRATLVGETTGGGAHPAGPHRIDDHFQFRVPDARPINPISKTDWEGTGVTPDVKVDAGDALKTAEALAAKKLRHVRN